MGERRGTEGGKEGQGNKTQSDLVIRSVPEHTETGMKLKRVLTQIPPHILERLEEDIMRGWVVVEGGWQ